MWYFPLFQSPMTWVEVSSPCMRFLTLWPWCFQQRCNQHELLQNDLTEWDHWRMISVKEGEDSPTCRQEVDGWSYVDGWVQSTAVMPQSAGQRIRKGNPMKLIHMCVCALGLLESSSGCFWREYPSKLIKLHQRYKLSGTDTNITSPSRPLNIFLDLLYNPVYITAVHCGSPEGIPESLWRKILIEHRRGNVVPRMQQAN